MMNLLPEINVPNRGGAEFGIGVEEEGFDVTGLDLVDQDFL